MIFKFGFSLILLFVSLFISTEAHASSSQFVTIVNPVRISVYTHDIGENLKSQYKAIKDNDLPATWLLTYDVLKDNNAFAVLQRMNKQQEFGIFFEVTPNYAFDSGVKYHETGSWHHASSVFLSGYTQEERVRLINTAFSAFYEKFGYYPVSVGSWWTDSYSLTYMKDKYGIMGNLGVSDQFATDGYQVWGTYWSTPYYPSRTHLGVPAQNIGNKLDVVNLQWAHRDPLNGYFSSLYSTQDFSTVREKLDIGYFEKLVRLYALKNSNQFGQITVGLEADLSPESYEGGFKAQIDIVKKLSDEGSLEITNMKSFTSWYRNTFKELSPPQRIESDDLFRGNQKVIWYQSPKYRIGLLINKDTNISEIFDLRIYSDDFVEPYYISPNNSNYLSIYVPSLIDKFQNETGKWSLVLKESEIKLLPDMILIKRIILGVPKSVRISPQVQLKTFINKLEIRMTNIWLTGINGYQFRDFTVETLHNLKSKRFLLGLLVGKGWDTINRETYFVSQGEIDVLFHLSLLPMGRVLIYDSECLQCSWHTQFKPAVFANLRGYVSKFGKHSVVTNVKVFSAKTREESKKEFDKTRAKYVYLSKLESYKETLPYSPGDLNLIKVYENANAELWMKN